MKYNDLSDSLKGIDLSSIGKKARDTVRDIIAIKGPVAIDISTPNGNGMMYSGADFGKGKSSTVWTSIGRMKSPPQVQTLPRSTTKMQKSMKGILMQCDFDFSNEPRIRILDEM